MINNETSLDEKLHWYKDAIIYELHIKAFNDSNGDGIGDFKGLLGKLDYLQELGITAIWLLPFYPSPLKDDGYDIADYYTINPSYGNIDQFKQFLTEAHKRNLRVITELVVNHTSDQHPWFQRARRAPKGSPERDYYVWTDDPTKYKDVRIIFQDFEASNWSWDPVAKQYYWHRFFNHQPDLNYDSLLVQEEIFEILDYWCEMGVDGFRLDAIPYLFEREGTNGENLPETHAFLKKLRAHIDEKFPGTVFLAEANMWPEDSASYFGNGDECHMNYHFPVMPRMFMAVQREDRYPITDIFDQTPPIPPTCQWAMFLRNHDELTLEMVTDEERDYMYTVYAKDPKARINLGIRHRLAPLMDNDRRKIELMNSLLFSMPGTPVIYYGDEIGMGDNYYLGDRNGVRTPMQWSPDRNAGFSTANPHSLYLPVIIDPEYNYEAVNVETQHRNTSSLFWFMKRIITMRKKYKAFGRGNMQFINVENPKVLAFTRTYEDETLLIVVNLSKFSQAAELDLSAFKGFIPVEAFSKNPFPSVKENKPYFFTLGAHSFQWFELKPPKAEKEEKRLIPELSISTISDLLTESVKTELEYYILPHYLLKTNWFLGKERRIYSISIVEHETIKLKDSNAYVTLLEVNYETGLPEWYILPLTLVHGHLASAIEENYPQAVLTRLKVGAEEGFLCDAYFTTEFQGWLFSCLANNEVITLNRSVLHFTAKDVLKQQLQKEEVKARMHQGEQNNTAITYNNNFFLKMYRKVDRGINPDLEISKYLTEEANYPDTPQYIGNIEWMLERDSIELGMVQVMVENHGDGHTFMMERLNNFIERILARDRSTLHPELRLGSLTEPLSHEELPEGLQILIGSTAAEQSHLFGIRIAQLHLALSVGTNLKDFEPEEFSLHYQRSLFSSMQSLVRETYQSLERNMNKLPENLQWELKKISGKREEILKTLKKIYSRKLNVLKTRIHGFLHLRQILFTGKDIAIHDFGGNPLRSYSERRLKRSPLRDVSFIVQSFYYVAQEAFLTTRQVPKEEVWNLMSFASMWSYYMSGFFIKAYLETVKGTSLVPTEKEDLNTMLQTYLLEGALHHLNYALNKRPDHITAPLNLIDSIMTKQVVLT
jgi:maltose alpha-D-glucosyltransferase/alpha-amylase